MAETKWFKFGKGLAQRTDDRLLEPGTPRAIENLVQIKDGRLEMRKDFDALSTIVLRDGQFFSTLTLHDLIEYKGRLLGLGQVDSAVVVTPKVPIDIVEYVNQPQFAWRCTDISQNVAISLATNVSNTGGIGSADNAITVVDVAAGGGRICMVWNDGTRTRVHIVDAATNATVFVSSVSSMSFPRVVFCGSAFWISGVIADAIVLRRYDPATDLLLVSMTNPAAATTTILCFDMTLSNEGTTFWIVAGRAAGFRIHGFDTAGTETHDFNGAAIVADFIGIFTEAVSGGVQRVHVCSVTTATGVVNMHTYTASTSTLQTGTVNIFATTAIGQPSMCIQAPVPGQIITAFQTGLNAVTAQFTNSTHVTTGGLMSYANAVLNGKISNINGRAFAAVTLIESVGTLTNVLVMFNRDDTRNLRPQVSIDRLVASQCSVSRLPNLATDASTGKTVWVRLTAGTGVATSIHAMSSFNICSTDRRQSAIIGDTLYIAGGMISAFDGRNVAEAGFMDRPRIISATQGSLGGVVANGTYQFVTVFEVFDANGNIIQSQPSDVVEVTTTGGNNGVTVLSTTQHSWHRPPSGTNGFNGRVNLVLYRTLNTAGGNLTFHRDTSDPVASGTDIGATQTMLSLQADATLSENAILYTQGARGSLSGPLGFDPPDACVSLAASADRILSGGLPVVAAIQESRAHLESEQVNWSDSIGFRREARGQVLAVARLDERRIIFTATEIFEMDGPGLDDNGNGDIGAPRRLPSDVGLFGGLLGWRSMIECSVGILFQGLASLIYLLPRGGTTPIPVGLAVQTQLAAFPTITAAVYLPEDQTVRFTCNNAGETDAISLLYNVVEDQWFVEGPYGTTVTAATKFGGRVCLLRSNTVFQQRATHPPAAFINNAWRSGTVHPFGPEQWGRVYAFHFYGEFRGDCQLTCTVRWDDSVTEVLTPVSVAPSVLGLAVGDPYSHKFTANQVKCESFRVDFDVTLPALQLVSQSEIAYTISVLIYNVTMPTAARIGDRVVFALVRQTTVQPNTPTGWRLVGSNSVAGLAVSVFDRTIDGTEQSSVIVTAPSSATGGFAKVWLIRGQSSLSNTEITITTEPNTGATSIDVASLTPTWGSATNLWLFFVTIRSENTPPQITTFPTGFTGTGELQTVSTDQLIDGTIGWGSRTLAAASLDPTVCNYTRDAAAFSSSIGLIMAIRPAVVSEGLAYHHWGYDADPAGKSALKGPSQMS